MLDVDMETGWKFTQCFGDKAEIEEVTEADIISTVEFNQNGEYLATGDKGGRVVLFERNEDKQGCEYNFFTEFQSHEPEFDYLKSLEIEEKINKIKWLPQNNNSLFMLTSNDKTIKLWKICEKSLKIVTENNLLDGQRNAPVSLSQLRLPQLTLRENIIAAIPRRIYSNAHAYHINSISVNSDNETYLSADDLRINLWNLGVNNQSFNIVDIKPSNMQDLTEVITSAEFHSSCNTFMYSSSKGTIKLCDMRDSSLCDNYSKVFEEPEDPSTKNFFSEIISSVSDVKFSSDGRYILSRDYLTIRLWDINMESHPVTTINVHDYLRPKLCDLYENDCIFDKFECSMSGNGKSAMTGSYNNYFSIYDLENNSEEIMLQADKSAFKAMKVTSSDGSNAKSKVGVPKDGREGIKKDDVDPDFLDYSRKILHSSWHPKEDTIAVAATNNLFIFTN
ncbi:Protein phosphatase PP2A regulatory subunit B [Smittium culicis]|uniref:Protein phosphatase PP2A regulatory subunit B n=1 Tax=Smittium culicis TaxID=133412 RepID=A0A1R1XQB8_9FUNG|nr:Protein phosphatase PP2A regulatory subunit B [Smittium culicis]